MKGCGKSENRKFSSHKKSSKTETSSPTSQTTQNTHIHAYHHHRKQNISFSNKKTNRKKTALVRKDREKQHFIPFQQQAIQVEEKWGGRKAKKTNEKNPTLSNWQESEFCNFSVWNSNTNVRISRTNSNKILSLSYNHMHRP